MIGIVLRQSGIETTTSVEVRRRTPADRDELVAMYLSFEPKGVALGLPPRKEPEGWLDGLAGQPNFVVCVNDRIVGHGLLCPEGDVGEVAVFIHQDFRGRGLGKRLLSELIREARRLHLRRVWGMTEVDNVPMLRLAYSLGFVRSKDPREFYLDLEQKTPAGPDEFSPT